MIQALNIIRKTSNVGFKSATISSSSFMFKSTTRTTNQQLLLNNKRFYSTENSNSTGSTIINNSESINESVKAIPSYIINPTMGPDAPRISEWFHQFNFDIISIFNDLHCQNGIPWIGIIAGTAVTLRLLTLPVSIKTQKDGVVMRKVKEEVEKHSYLNDGTTEGKIKVMQLQQSIMKKNGLSTMSTLLPNLLQLPFILYPFVLLRQLCADTTLLHDAGFLWFKNLSVIDPFYVLPVISSVFQYASVRFSMQDDTAPIMKYVMTGLCFVPLCFTINFAAGLNIYWAINSTIFALTNYFLKTKKGAKLFGIPYKEKVDKIKVAPDTFTTVKNTNLNNYNTNSSNNNAELQSKREELLKTVQEKKDMLEKKKQELKSFGRRK